MLVVALFEWEDTHMFRIFTALLTTTVALSLGVLGYGYVFGTVHWGAFYELRLLCTIFALLWFYRTFLKTGRKILELNN